MSSIHFLRKAGLFLREHVLDANTDGEYAIDHELRRSLGLRMPASRTLVEDGIDALRPAVADHAQSDDHLPTGPVRRQFALIIFVNPASGAPGLREYAGVDLRLYGILDDAAFKEYGFSIPPMPGLLVAFRADMRHEVTPVISGTRFVIVDRFL